MLTRVLWTHADAYHYNRSHTIWETYMMLSIRRGSLISVCLLAWLWLLAPVAAGDAQSTGSAVYWGAYIPDVPWDLSKLETFERNANKRVSIIHWGQPWMMNGQLQPFQTEQYDAVRAHGAIPMLNWG